MGTIATLPLMQHLQFETYLLNFETYLVLRDYETEKSTGAPAPAAPASLAPMMIHYNVER